MKRVLAAMLAAMLLLACAALAEAAATQSPDALADEALEQVSGGYDPGVVYREIGKPPELPVPELPVMKMFFFSLMKERSASRSMRFLSSPRSME